MPQEEEKAVFLQTVKELLDLRSSSNPVSQEVYQAFLE